MYCGSALERLAAPGEISERGPASASPMQPSRGRSRAREREARRASRQGLTPGLEGERRVVTILFCDVKGSTSLAESLDPEEWAEIMNEAFGYLIRPVYRYAGTVARLMGDAILAFFGAPTAQEDDPQRAILASLEIISGIRSFRERMHRERGLEFDVRVGIHTGLVVVGEIGNDLAMEYTAMGDAVNLAARVEQVAEPGSVLITEDTYRLVSHLFEVEALGEIEIRGKRQPVQAYRVLGLNDHPERGGLSAPLVGRDTEISLLLGALEQVRLGEGGIVCLTGEAGLGKSRLVEELRREWLAASPASKAGWREGRLVTHTAALPYAVFQSLVRGLCGIESDDSPAAIRKKLAQNCLPPGAAKEQQKRVVRVFEVLLGAQRQSGSAPLEGEAFKRELFQAMLFTWEAWARLAPVVLAFDDLQWADPASVELLMHLFQLTERAPVLFLCAFRPERLSPAWALKAYVEQTFPERHMLLELNPLSDQDSGRLLAGLLEIEPGDEVKRMVLEKAEGNPFFVEEVVRTLIECGAVVREEGGEGPGRWRVENKIQEITIPDNVQTLVMARIDRLGEAERYVLQVAAVIGRSFERPVLAEVLGEKEPLDQRLQVLEEAGILQVTARSPQVEYTFRHALTHETLYNAILLKRRRLIHQRVGEALEKLYAEKLDEYAALLAHHFHEGGDPRAVDYYIRAAERAYRLYANAEVVAHVTQALELGEKTPGQPLPYGRLFMLRGRALELSTRHRQALANYLELEELARRKNDRKLLLSALTAQAVLRATPTPVSDPELARRLCEGALDLAWELNDQEAAAKIMWALLLVNVRGGRTEEAVLYGERALSLARDYNLKETLGFTLNDISQAYLATGQVRRGRKTLDEARKIWEELDNLPMLADSLSTAALFDYFMGNYQSAVRGSEKALEIGRRIDNLWTQAYALMYLGNVYIEFGEIGRAIQVMEECLRLAEKAQFVAPLVNTRAELGKIYATMGQIERGRGLVFQAKEIAGRYTPPWFPWVLTEQAQFHILAGEFSAAEEELDRAWEAVRGGDPIGLTTAVIPLVRSQLALAQGDYPRVLELIKELRPYRKIGLRTFMPDFDYRCGMALFGLGRIAQARKYLEAGRKEAEALGSRRILWRILKALGDVEQRRGDLQAAEEHWRRSAEIVEFITAHIWDEALKTAFLETPEVQSLRQVLAQVVHNSPQS